MLSLCLKYAPHPISAQHPPFPRKSSSNHGHAIFSVRPSLTILSKLQPPVLST